MALLKTTRLARALLMLAAASRFVDAPQDLARFGHNDVTLRCDQRILITSTARPALQLLYLVTELSTVNLEMPRSVIDRPAAKEGSGRRLPSGTVMDEPLAGSDEVRVGAVDSKGPQ